MNPRQVLAANKKKASAFISYRGNRYGRKDSQDFRVFYGNGFLEITMGDKTTNIETWNAPEIEVEANLELLGFTCIYRLKIH